MATQITGDIVAGYLKCKLKGHLQLTSQHGDKSEYEMFLTDQRSTVRLAAIDQILAEQPMDHVERGISVTRSTLKRGASFILDGLFEDDEFSIEFDGLKRIDESSKLGAFHYVPMLFYESQHVQKVQKLQLEVYGLLIARLQGRKPSFGIMWHGKECQSRKVKFNTDLRDAEQILESLQQLRAGTIEPPLLLNDHCQVCEFRLRCHARAVTEDHLSLLRGIGAKEIKRYARKGIFTLTQLSHTFRPRRKGKRGEAGSRTRQHALQAMAIRDKTIYVLGTPTLPTKPVTIYFDIESSPEDGYVYLIGLIICEGNAEKRLSFWADSKEDELSIFETFLETVTHFEDFVVFTYGSYETSFLKRIRKRNIALESQIDRVLKSTVNVLSVIYTHIYFPTYSNGLKDIGRCLGFTWSEPDASGLRSILWRTGNENGSSTNTCYSAKDVKITHGLSASIALGTNLSRRQNVRSHAPPPPPPRNSQRLRPASRRPSRRGTLGQSP